MKDKFKGYPELNIAFNIGLQKYNRLVNLSLFIAMGEMVALEKGIIDEAAPLNLKSRAKLAKDVCLQNKNRSLLFLDMLTKA